MSSNIKPKTPAKEAPNEPFKRAVTGCLRALARHPELEVAFAAERPGLAGTTARLPEPPRKLTATDVAIVRGHADSIALRVACHDGAVHRRLLPSSQQARAVFEAVEQARVEAIGARRMQGVADNLDAMLDDKFHRGKFDEITEREDAPIEEALAMLVRERLTGRPPPPAARRMVDLWRSFIEGRAGRRTSIVSRTASKTSANSAMWCIDLLESLDMGEDRGNDDEDDSDESNDKGRQDDKGEDGDSSESEDNQRMSLEQAEASSRGSSRQRGGSNRRARVRHAGRFGNGQF